MEFSLQIKHKKGVNPIRNLINEKYVEELAFE